jgi:hypothetical protein
MNNRIIGVNEEDAVDRDLGTMLKELARLTRALDLRIVKPARVALDEDRAWRKKAIRRTSVARRKRM